MISQIQNTLLGAEALTFIQGLKSNFVNCECVFVLTQLCLTLATPWW